MTSLTEAQVNFVIDCVERWVAIKDRNGDHALNVADPSHSILLPHLLLGHEPLPYRPPLTYSRPDYDLAMHGGHVRAFFSQVAPCVVINSSPKWTLVEGDEAGAVVLWPYSGLRYRLTPLTAPTDGLPRWSNYELVPEITGGGEA